MRGPLVRLTLTPCWLPLPLDHDPLVTKWFDVARQRPLWSKPEKRIGGGSSDVASEEHLPRPRTQHGLAKYMMLITSDHYVTSALKSLPPAATAAAAAATAAASAASSLPLSCANVASRSASAARAAFASERAAASAASSAAEGAAGVACAAGGVPWAADGVACAAGGVPWAAGGVACAVAGGVELSCRAFASTSLASRTFVSAPRLSPWSRSAIASARRALARASSLSIWA